MTERRLRLSHFTIQPVLTWDDGDDLTPGPPLAPRNLTLRELITMAEEWPTELAAFAAALATDE